MNDSFYRQVEQMVQDNQRIIDEAFRPYQGAMQQVSEVNLTPESAKQLEQRIELPNVIPGVKDIQQMLEDMQESINSLSNPRSLSDRQTSIEDFYRSVGVGTAEVERHLQNSRRIQEELRLIMKPAGFDNCPLSVLPSFKHMFGQ